MANSIGSFLETFVGAAASYNEAVVGQLALIDAVYKDVKSEVARAGKTINVYFPDMPPVVDQGVADWSPTDISANYVSLVFNQRPGGSFLVRDFEQFQTAVEIRDKFVDPLYKRCAEYLNVQIAGVINSTNFSANAPITGASPAEVTVADQLNAWSTLANSKVPLDDSNDLFLLCHPDTYRRMLSDPQWVQENVVSAMIAREAREEGKLANAFKFKPVWDQQMPTASGTQLQGKVSVVNGSTTVVGSNTRFTVDLTTANYLIFGNDPTRTPYSVSAITNDTTLTLGAAYTGGTAMTSAKRQTVIVQTFTTVAGSATVAASAAVVGVNVGDWIIFSKDTTLTPYQVSAVNSGGNNVVLTSPYSGTGSSANLGTVQKYTNVAMHRYAIALALRPLPEPDSNVVHWSYVDIKGIPMRLMASYQHLKNGWLVSVDFGFALSVIRPEFGVVINT